MKTKNALLMVLFLWGATLAFSQERATGAILDPALYAQVPEKATQLSRSYSNLPRAVSLKSYTPTPGDQGDLGTCTGWASAFASRTILESVALGRQNKAAINASVFSPVYTYQKATGNFIGKEGTSLPSVLDSLKEGAVKMNTRERLTPFASILRSLYPSGTKLYPIADYVRLSDSANSYNVNIDAVKKSLSEQKPVLIALNCPLSFMRITGDTWYPTENPGRWYGGHAVCVVGYDDEKAGGAFEIQNSWGSDWANNGYAWIPYTTFQSWVREAYELIENLALYQDATEYAGYATIEVRNTAVPMAVQFNSEGYYKTTTPYPSGTIFHFLLGNNKKAYIYAFSADNSRAPSAVVFPQYGVSPVLNYQENIVAWPGENTWIKMDDVTGTDYLVILYSKQALNLSAIQSRFDNAWGKPFVQRVQEAVGPHFLPVSAGRYEQNEVRFSATSTDALAVFAVLLAIDHNERIYR